jgi:hypothetical protein
VTDATGPTSADGKVLQPMKIAAGFETHATTRMIGVPQERSFSGGNPDAPKFWRYVAF